MISRVIVSRSPWDDLLRGTSNGFIVKLIAENGFEAVSYWIDVVDESEPDIFSQKLRLCDHISSVNTKPHVSREQHKFQTAQFGALRSENRAN